MTIQDTITYSEFSQLSENNKKYCLEHFLKNLNDYPRSIVRLLHGRDVIIDNMMSDIWKTKIQNNELELMV